jgi:hypothetical protein
MVTFHYCPVVESKNRHNTIDGNDLARVFSVFDFPLSVHFSQTSPSFSGWRAADERWEVRLGTSA